MWKHFVSHVLIYLLFEIMKGAYLTPIHDCCIDWVKPGNLTKSDSLHLSKADKLQTVNSTWLSSYEQLNDSSDSFQFL